MKPESLAFLLGRFFTQSFFGPKGSRHLAGAALGLAFSLVPLVLVMVLSQGMITGILDRSLETWTGHLQVTGFGATEEEFEALRPQLESRPGIRGVYAERQGFGLAYSGTKRMGVQLRSVEDQWWSDPAVARLMEVKEGKIAPGGVIVGAQVAARLGLKVGDEMKIMTARSLGSRGFLPRITTFPVTAVVSVGYQDLDKLWVFLDPDQGKKLLPQPDFSPVYVIKVDDPYHRLPQLQAEIQDTLSYQWLTRSWTELSRSQYENYQANRTILLIIMALIVLVGAVNITSSLVMIVLDRSRDIAILKSLGCSPGGIALVFTGLGLITGVVGTALGLGVGSLLALNLNGLVAGLNGLMDVLLQLFSPGSGPFKLLNPEFYLETIPLSLPQGELGLAAGGALVLSVLAALIPAWTARNLKPVEILRKH